MKHLARALDGQNQWWKYLLVLFIALIIGQSIGTIPLVILMIVKKLQLGEAFVMPENNMDLSAYGIDPNFGLILLVIPFLVTLFLLIVLIKSFHHRNLKDVINGGRKFRWNRFWIGAGVWGAMTFIGMAVSIALNPDDFEFHFNLASFIPLVVISLVFIPFQSGTEEFLFRGYLAQGVAGWTKRPCLVILIPTLLFALMHSVNPEVKEYGFWIMMPQYIILALVFAVISVLDDGIELAIGLHSINNIMSSIFITTKASAIQTPALFLQKKVDPVSDLLGLLVASLLLFAVLFFIFKWNFDVLKKKIMPSEGI